MSATGRPTDARRCRRLRTLDAPPTGRSHRDPGPGGAAAVTRFVNRVFGVPLEPPSDPEVVVSPQRDDQCPYRMKGNVMVGQAILDGVLEMLRERPGLAVSELAAGTGLSRSTAGKALAELESQNRARRVLPEKATQPGPSKPTLWYPPTDTPEAPAIRQQTTQDTDARDENASNATDQDDLAVTLAPPVATPPAPTPDADGATPTIPDDDNSPTIVDGADRSELRLRKGELRALVLDRLNAEPDAEFTPTALSKQLTRSSGAITNALVRLCLDGQAVETSTRPRRYGAAPRKAA